MALTKFMAISWFSWFSGNPVIIKHFYEFLYIYKLLHSKFYISNMTMAGIASVTPGHFVPLVRFNLSIIYNIKEGHNFSMINPQSDSRAFGENT